MENKSVPSTDTLLIPFNPYIKRFGFMYIHFKNGKGILAKEWSDLVLGFWNNNVDEYNSKVEQWCKENCVI